MQFSKRQKTVAIYLFLAVILGLFAYYIYGHQSVLSELKHISPWLIIVLVLGYGLMLVVLMAVYNATLDLCGKPLKTKENLIMSIYSTLTNFFMPLQSGIAVRAGYLKTKHKVAVSSYIMASLVYFAIYAVLSSIILFATGKYFWLILPGMASAVLISYLVLRLASKHFARRNVKIKLDLSRNKIARLTLVVIVQLAVQSAIYFLELRQVSGSTSLLRAISYTGAANFSLFVALTPGAIGFREAFLSIAHRLHGFSNAQILGANIIDRGVFLIFLGCIFIVMLATHAQNRFSQTKPAIEQ